MAKFQDAIVSAGEARADFNPQQPTSAFLERERRFEQRADKIKALKQARTSLERGGQLPALRFEIVRHRGYWRTLHNKKHSKPYPDQAAAILDAKAMARKKRDLGHPVEVRLIRTDGKVVPQSLDGD